MKNIIVKTKKYINIYCKFKNNRIFAAEKYLISDEKYKSYEVPLFAEAWFSVLQGIVVAWQEQVHPACRLAITQACRWRGASET